MLQNIFSYILLLYYKLRVLFIYIRLVSKLKINKFAKLYSTITPKPQRFEQEAFILISVTNTCHPRCIFDELNQARARIGSSRTSVLCITHNTRSAERQIGRRQGGATVLVQRCTQEGNDKATTWPRTAAGLQTTVIHVSNSRDAPKSGFKLIFTRVSRSFHVVSFLFALRRDGIACSRTSTITHNWNFCSCVRKKGAECAMHLQIAISLLF